MSTAHAKASKKNQFDLGRFLEGNENRVNGMVYYGAAILIIIVGLRGLGSIAGELEIIPRWLLTFDKDGIGKVDPNWVLFALFLEFFMLLIMATFNFLKPVHMDPATPAAETAHAHAPASSDADIAALEERVKQARKAMDEINKLGQEKMAMVNGVIDQFEQLNKKINKIQSETLNSLNGIKDAVKH